MKSPSDNETPMSNLVYESSLSDMEAAGEAGVDTVFIDDVSNRMQESLFLDGTLDINEMTQGQSNDWNGIISENSSRTEAKKKSKKTKHTGHHVRKRWWKTLVDSDPITMEPLSSLKYPPFELESSSNSGKSVPHYFDGKVLAHYIVSTGNFTNPNTREALNRSDCVRLDEYLKRHRLNEAKVTDAFDLSKLVRIEGSSNDTMAQSRLTMLEREASVMMQSLFNFPSRRNERNVVRENPSQQLRHSGQSFVNRNMANSVIAREGAITLIDNDSWDSFDENLLKDREEFPEIPGSLNSNLSAYKAQQKSSSHIGTREEFPSLISEKHQNMVSGISGNSVWTKQAPERANFAEVAKRTQSHSTVSKPTQLTPTSLKIGPSCAAATLATRLRFGRIVDSILCPYMPSIVQSARKFGMNWVNQVQSRLSNFTRNLEMGHVMFPRFEAMSVAKRKFVQLLCSQYYGLECSVMDQNSSPWIEIMRAPYNMDFEIPIAQAIFVWESILNVNAPNAGCSYGRSHIALWNVASTKGGQLSNHQIHSALSAFLRQSQYNLLFCNPNNLLIEVFERKLCRKLYRQLKNFNSLGDIRWKCLQWWPCSLSWAVYQLELKEQAEAKLERSGDRFQVHKFRQNVHSSKTLQSTGWESDKESGNEDRNTSQSTSVNQFDLLGD